jgi:hypothetical protein
VETTWRGLAPTASIIASALAVLAAWLRLSVAMSEPRWATVALVSQTVLALVAPGLLVDVSGTGNGTIVAVALGIEFAAVVAVWLSRAQAAASEQPTA